MTMAARLHKPAIAGLLALAMLVAMLMAATPQSAFGARYWGDTDTIDEQTGTEVGETLPNLTPKKLEKEVDKTL